MIELGIVDIREINRLIKSKYDLDFSQFALTTLKYRLEYVISVNNISNSESLLRKLNEYPDFLDSFLYHICVPSTEMFRDPSLWRWLRENYFSKIDLSHRLSFKIWLPYCVSGGELFTLAILLKEINLLDKVKILATTFSKQSVEYIKSGKYPSKKIEISEENYIRFQGSENFSDYYKSVDSNFIRDVSLIENVEFIIDTMNYTKAPSNIMLILFRNALIYYNPSFHDRIVEKMHSCLMSHGTFIIGQKEQIKNNHTTESLFEPLELSENIFTKKTV